MLLALVLAFGLTGAAHAQPKPVLTVYSYSSFVGKYGPGKTVKERFEAVCGCEVAYVSAEDAGSLVGRLRLEGDTTKADVVLGLDMNLAAEAKALNLFASPRCPPTGSRCRSPGPTMSSSPSIGGSWHSCMTTTSSRLRRRA